jgi:hypothetical protein
MQQLADRVRAPRYEMSAPLLYRPDGSGDWMTGRTVNISRTGVLFTGLAPELVPATRVEFVLLLQSLGHPGRSRVQCQGKVVRVTRTATDGACAMAATIDGYEFLGIGPEVEPGAGDVGPGGTVRN